MQQFLFILLGFFLTVFTFSTNAQSTYTRVHNLFQAKCISCHNSIDNAGALNLSGSANATYPLIVNATPSNSVAATKGDKLIEPGYPERSFLLRKAANGFDFNLNLEPGEEDSTNAHSSVVLADSEKELIRQWVLYGAPQSGSPVDVAVFQEFYNNGGLPKLAAPPAPSATEGVQIKLGPIFLEPREEIEFLKKHDFKLADDLEINRIEVFMNWQSHHFILYKFSNPNNAAAKSEGLRVVSITNTPFSGGSKYLSAWQNSADIELPPGTAFSWTKESVLDLNYHLLNYSDSLVLAAEVYINVYTQPKATAAYEMNSVLVQYDVTGLSNGKPFYIGGGAQETFIEPYYKSNNDNYWKLHLLASHTHKYGTAYNIYKRKPDGTKGDKIYDGFYNENHSQFMGYYNWSHPPVRNFPYDANMMIVKASDGLIQEASYNNFGTMGVGFGLTTNDEMMLFYMQYTEHSKEEADSMMAIIDTTTSIANTHDRDNSFDIFPNPYADIVNINFVVTEKSSVKLEVYDLVGRNVKQLLNDEQTPGKYTYKFSAKSEGLTAGTYIIKLDINGKTITRKVIEL